MTYNSLNKSPLKTYLPYLNIFLLHVFYSGFSINFPNNYITNPNKKDVNSQDTTKENDNRRDFLAPINLN